MRKTMGRNTVEYLTLENGEVVELTLNFASLIKIRNKRKEAYEKLNKIMMNGTNDMLDAVTVVYAAYLCSNAEDLDNTMSEEEFVEVLPMDIDTVIALASRLIRPKKQTDSDKPSGGPESQNEE